VIYRRYEAPGGGRESSIACGKIYVYIRRWGRRAPGGAKVGAGAWVPVRRGDECNCSRWTVGGAEMVASGRTTARVTRRQVTTPLSTGAWPCRGGHRGRESAPPADGISPARNIVRMMFMSTQGRGARVPPAHRAVPFSTRFVAGGVSLVGRVSLLMRGGVQFINIIYNVFSRDTCELKR